MELEGDGKHRKDILKMWGLGEDTNSAKDLRMKVKENDEDENKVELDRGER